MNSGYDDTWNETTQATHDREVDCVKELNEYLNNEVILYTEEDPYIKYDCSYNNHFIDLEEKKPEKILDDGYIFSRGLSFLCRKINGSETPKKALYLIYGTSQNKRYGYIFTYEYIKKYGILEDHNARKDCYFVLNKLYSGDALPFDKLCERIKRLCNTATWEERIQYNITRTATHAQETSEGTAWERK
jgi:hypothetical protein